MYMAPEQFHLPSLVGRRKTAPNQETEAARENAKMETCSYALFSMWLRNAPIEPNRNVPCGNCASIDPSE
jgi:hypothetical protein